MNISETDSDWGLIRAKIEKIISHLIKKIAYMLKILTHTHANYLGTKKQKAECLPFHTFSVQDIL